VAIFETRSGVAAVLPLSTGNTSTNLVFGPSVDALIAKNGSSVMGLGGVSHDDTE